MDITLGIVITTYQRSDNTTPQLISRTIESIEQQSYSNFIVFIIGDNYIDNDEFEHICKNTKLQNKIIYENLSYAKERDTYPIGSKELWCSGGVNARNHGIDLALQHNLSYVCHLDHDDYWHPQHLEIINHAIKQTNAALVHTCATYFDKHLPHVPLSNTIVKTLIRGGNCIHSSVCINHNAINLRYRDVYAETGNCQPADADLWDRIREYCILNNLETYLITSLTCFHPNEGI